MLTAIVACALVGALFATGLGAVGAIWGLWRERIDRYLHNTLLWCMGVAVVAGLLHVPWILAILAIAGVVGGAAILALRALDRRLS